MKKDHPPAELHYPDWLAQWKGRIQAAQIKAAMRVNTELLRLYWALGSDIVAKQQTTAWGEGLIPRFAKDLKAAFPHLTGFSRTNLFYIRKWYLFYREDLPIVPQLVAQLTKRPVARPVSTSSANRSNKSAITNPRPVSTSSANRSGNMKICYYVRKLHHPTSKRLHLPHL